MLRLSLVNCIAYIKLLTRPLRSFCVGICRLPYNSSNEKQYLLLTYGFSCKFAIYLSHDA